MELYMGWFGGVGKRFWRAFDTIIGDRFMVNSSVEGGSSDGRFPSHVYIKLTEESRGF